jgi:hypothetical protein
MFTRRIGLPRPVCVFRETLHRVSIAEMTRAVSLVVLLSLALAGCGPADEAEKAIDDLRAEAKQLKERVGEYRERADELREDAGKVGERLRKRVEKALEDLRKSVPSASLPEPTSQDRGAENAIERFLTSTLESIDTYWTRTLTTAGLPEPRVSYAWIPPGRVAMSGCGQQADDSSAYYCPRDDTIYIGERFAQELWEGVSRTFPGQAAGQGKAVGDFGLAYVVAHEYGHNIQEELGFFSRISSDTAKPFELQADCFAGAWGNAVYNEGQVSEEDVQEALGTAMAAGDFEVNSEQHHGTPEERRDAWLLGWTTGDPQECSRFVAV